VSGTQGAVAVENDQCSHVGLDGKGSIYSARKDVFTCVFVALKDGGTAVDAAIASALCIGVINSFATGMFRIMT